MAFWAFLLAFSSYILVFWAFISLHFGHGAGFPVILAFWDHFGVSIWPRGFHFGLLKLQGGYPLHLRGSARGASEQVVRSLLLFLHLGATSNREDTADFDTTMQKRNRRCAQQHLTHTLKMATSKLSTLRKAAAKNLLEKSNTALNHTLMMKT